MRDEVRSGFRGVAQLRQLNASYTLCRIEVDRPRPALVLVLPESQLRRYPHGFGGAASERDRVHIRRHAVKVNGERHELARARQVLEAIREADRGSIRSDVARRPGIGFDAPWRVGQRQLPDVVDPEKNSDGFTASARMANRSGC